MFARLIVLVLAAVLVVQVAKQRLRAEEAAPNVVPRSRPLPAFEPRPTECARYELDSVEICESSGLARSATRTGVLWTHNDSGDEPRLFALSTEGKVLHSLPIQGAKAIDWEDMASCEIDGIPYLVIADTGDNQRRRKSYQIYLIREPRHPGEALSVEKTIDFRYETGPRDCESIAVDSQRREILLVSKDALVFSRLFRLAWPTAGGSVVSQVARPAAMIPLAPVTGMDICPDGSRLVLLTYAEAFQYTREPGEAWDRAVSRRPQRVVLPWRPQGEAICYSQCGDFLFTTSEKLPAPLWKVALQRLRVQEPALDPAIEQTGGRDSNQQP